MKNIALFLFVVSFVGAAYADCSLTNHVLKQGSDAKYDEYLYPDGSYSEMRQEGANVRAYLCGYDACQVGDVVRLTGAAIGGGGTKSDAVYKCNKSSGGRDNYHWLASDVESVCAVAGAKFKYDEKLKLYVYGNKYCKEIDEVKQLANVFNIQNNTLINNITHNVDIDITQVYNNITVNNIVVKKNLSAADIQLIGRLIRKSESEIRSDLTKIGVTVAGLKKDVARLETLVNKIGAYEFMNHLDISALRSRMLAAESNQKALEALIDDVAKAGLSPQAVNDVQTLIRQAAAELKVDINQKINALNARVGALEKNDARLERLINQIGAYEFVNHLNINALRSRMLAAESNQKALEALIDDVAKAGLSPQALNDVQTLIRQAAADLQVDINALNARVGALEKNDARLERLINQIGAYEFVNHLNINALRSRMLAAESNQKALEALIDDVAKAGLSPQAVNDVQNLIRQAATELKVDINQKINVLNARVAALEKNDARLEKLINQIGAYEFMNHLNINALRSRMLAAESNQKALEALIDDVAKAGLSPQALNDVQTLIRQAAADLQVDINALNARVGALEKNDVRLNALIMSVQTELAGYQKYNNANIDSLRTRMLAAESNQKALEIMIQDVAAAGLSPQAVKDVQALIDAAAQDLRVDLSDIYNRLGLVESNVAALQVENQVLLGKIANLQSLTAAQRNQINALSAQLKNKTTPEEVVALIISNTQNLSEGQKKEVLALIVEYTSKLTDGQKAQVEALIKAYVDPRFELIGNDISLIRQQEQARDKITSSMSVLNAFVAGADVSVWKNKEGKFNTARLVSDATAGVVLGTAGGLISNHLIKKNQVKKGMEAIRCTVGGQTVAEYGDEFMVGMQ